MYALLVTLVIAPDVGRLGCDDFGVRDGAEERLRFLGLLAWPHLLTAEHSHDPEVRHRAHRLLAPYRIFRMDMDAAAVLLDPWPMPAGRACGFFLDEPLRRRCYKIATAAGCTDVWHLLPENTPADWWQRWTGPAMCQASMERARTKFGYPAVGWPFTK